MSSAATMQARKRKKSRKSKKTEPEEEEVTLKFRNYAPSDAPVPDEDAKPQPSVAKQTEEQIEKELQQSMVTNKDEAVRITPKSPNWDLKRDIADKMKKLERMTLRAIRDLVKERIAAEQPDEDSSSSSSSSGDEDSSDGSDDDSSEDS